jgi:hypothetical protein
VVPFRRGCPEIPRVAPTGLGGSVMRVTPTAGGGLSPMRASPAVPASATQAPPVIRYSRRTLACARGCLQIRTAWGVPLRAAGAYRGGPRPPSTWDERAPSSQREGTSPHAGACPAGCRDVRSLPGWAAEGRRACCSRGRSP